MLSARSDRPFVTRRSWLRSRQKWEFIKRNCHTKLVRVDRPKPHFGNVKTCTATWSNRVRTCSALMISREGYSQSTPFRHVSWATKLRHS